MPQQLTAIIGNLERAADTLTQLALQEKRLDFLGSDSRRRVIFALRQLFLAKGAGAKIHPVAFGLFGPIDPTDEQACFSQWRTFTLAYLRCVRPESFPPHTGYSDQPIVKTDRKGRVRLNKLGDAVTDWDGLDDDGRLSKLRQWVRESADGCRAAVAFLRDAQAGDGETKSGPSAEPEWTAPDSPQRWAKRFGFSVDTLKRRFKDGTIRHKKLSSKNYQIAVDDLPAVHQAKFRNGQHPPAK